VGEVAPFRLAGSAFPARERTWLFRLPEGHAVRNWHVTTERTTADAARRAGWDVEEVEPVAPNLTAARDRHEDARG
jgi:hypothetical protein